MSEEAMSVGEGKRSEAMRTREVEDTQMGLCTAE